MANGLPQIRQKVYGDQKEIEKLIAGFKVATPSGVPEFAPRTGGRPPGSRTASAVPAPAAGAVPAGREDDAARLYANALYLAQLASIPGADPRFRVLAADAMAESQAVMREHRANTVFVPGSLLGV